MWELDHKEAWVPKNRCFQTVVLEKILEIPLDSKEIKPVSPKGSQLNIHWKDWGWRILWPLDSKNWLLGKDPEDEIVEWHHWLNGHEFEQIQGVGDGQGSLLAAVHGVAKSLTQLSKWTTATTSVFNLHIDKTCSHVFWAWFSFAHLVEDSQNALSRLLVSTSRDLGGYF